MTNDGEKPDIRAKDIGLVTAAAQRDLQVALPPQVAGSDADGMDRYTRATVIGAAVLVFGLGGWAATVPLSGAVIAGATVVADSNLKKVQHQQGGIVAELRVKNGDQVAADDLLLKLDPTQLNANLQVAAKALDQGVVREARLKAERDGLKAILFSDAIAARQAEPDLASMIAEETRLFDSRRSAREGNQQQLRERIEQLKEEIRGLEAQRSANKRQAEVLAQELVGVRDLFKRNLVQISRISALEREEARLAGEDGQLISTIAKTKGKITETELQILQIDQDMRSDVSKDIRETQAKNIEFFERKIALEDQISRIDIRSPQAGLVHQLSVNNKGAVISPGETIMIIVPREDVLVLEAKIAPQDISHVFVGQSAIARLVSFNQKTTPEVEGKITFVSPDLVRDAQSNVSYYLSRMTLDSRKLESMSDIKLVPGMPAEVNIITGDRTALSYLLKPLSEQMARAFKER